MSTVTKDDPQYDEPSSSTICGDSDLHVGDTTQVTSKEHAILIDEEDEHYSTGYSEFCDDDTILLADPDTISNDYSSPTGSFPATTLGKRKAAPEDSGLSNSVYASYKRHTLPSTGGDSVESSIQPYIIVSLDQSSLSVSKSFLFVNRLTTRVCNARWISADFPGESSGKSPVSFHAAIAHGKISPCLTSIASEKREPTRSPMIRRLSLTNLLPLTSRTYSGGIKKALVTKDRQRRFRQLYDAIMPCPYNLIIDHCCYSHLGLSWTWRTWPSTRKMATPAF
jgi:hypothetical protein